jgi:hypothetical protein
MSRPERDVGEVEDRTFSRAEQTFMTTTFVDAFKKGSVFFSQGKWEEALSHFAPACRLSTETLGPRASLTLMLQEKCCIMLIKLGRYDEALPISRENAKNSLEVLGEAHETTIAAQNNTALLLMHTGRLKVSGWVGMNVWLCRYRDADTHTPLLRRRE